MAEKTNDENIEIKRSLIHTRDIIKKKFRKLHSDITKKKRELEERYQPITKRLQKLIDINNDADEDQYKRPNFKYQNFASGEQDYANNDDDDEEMLSVADVKPTNSYVNQLKIKRLRTSDYDERSAKDKKSRRNSQISLKSESSVNNLTNTAVTNPSNQQQTTKRNRETEESEFIPDDKKMREFFERISKNNDNDNNDDDAYSLPETSIASNKTQLKRKRMQKTVDDLNNLHDIRMTGLQKSKKKNPTRNLNDDSLIVVSPQDYDEHGKFRGPGVKRSKHAVPQDKLKKTVRNLTSKVHFETPKRRNAKKVEKIKTDPKPRNKPKIYRKPWKQIVRRLTARGKVRKIKTALIGDDLRLRRLTKNQISGKGLEEEFIPYTENITYEYYDDPNELCERLMLLVSSKEAGNSNHSREINSIIEELRERNIIE